MPQDVGSWDVAATLYNLPRTPQRAGVTGRPDGLMDKDRQAPPRKARVQTRLPEQMQASCELERSHQTWNELREATGGPACDPRAPGSHITRGEFASAGGIFSTDLTRCSQGGLGAGRGPESLPHVEPQRGAAALWGRHSLTQILLPSPQSTEAPSTGDKMENPVTLTAPAETQSWEGREEEENPPPTRAQIIRQLLPLAGDRIIPKAPSMELRGTALA